MLSPENELPRGQFVKDIFNGIADWVGKYRQKFGLAVSSGSARRTTLFALRETSE